MATEEPTRGPTARAQARNYAAIGVLAFWGVLLWLTVGAEYPVLDAVLLATLLAAVPGLAMALSLIHI